MIIATLFQSIRLPFIILATSTHLEANEVQQQHVGARKREKADVSAEGVCSVDQIE
jgi:hypothetical protein